MKFADPHMLYLVWLLPLLLAVYIYGHRRRSRILTRYAHPQTLGTIAPERAGSRRRLKAGLSLFGILLAILALAGPRYGYRWQEVQRRGVDLIIALDCSASMLAQDIKPSRLERAKHEIVDLLNMLEGDRAGLAAFAGTAFMQCPLTMDYEAFYLFLDSLTPGALPVGGTDLEAAVTTALQGFDARVGSEKAVILITDGENTTGDPFKAAATARKAGVRLFCIGVGQGDGTPIPAAGRGFKKDRSGSIVLSRLDEDTLRRMAADTGGVYVRSVAGDMDLEALYTREIRGRMEAEVLQSGRRQVWEDRFQWPLGLALAVLLMEIMLPLVRRSALVALATALCCLPLGEVHAGADRQLRRGAEAYEQGDYAAALKSFLDAQLDAPQRAEILYNLGNAYYRMKNFEAAVDHFRQAAAASQEPSLQQKSLYNLGNANYRQGDLKAAVSGYEKALELNPDDVETRQNLEFVRRRLQQRPQPPAGGNDSSPSGKKGRDSDRQDSERPPQGGQSQDGASAGSSSQDPGPGKDDRPQGAEQPPPESHSGSRAPGSAQELSEGGEGAEKTDASVAENASPSEPAGPTERKTEGTLDAQRVERMLNRLKDMPGAMTPAYRRRVIEKDW